MRFLSARIIFVVLVGSFVAALGASAALPTDAPEYWDDLAMSLVWYTTSAGILVSLAGRRGLHPRRVIGRRPSYPELARAAVCGVLAALFAVAAAYILFWALSYLWPEIVESVLNGMDVLIVTPAGSLPAIPNLLRFLELVLLAPFVEEYVFRGLLFQRWWAKWGIGRAIIGSSLVFAVVHVDLVGAFFFSFVMIVLYVNSRSLLLPFAAHAINNLLVWLVSMGEIAARGGLEYYSVEDLRSDWWIAAACAAVAVPWAYRFVRKNWPTASWQMPSDTSASMQADLSHPSAVC